MSIAALVLAAGNSSRLGTPKQLLLLHGERLLERAVCVCLEAGLKPVYVVLGASAEQIQAECDLGDARVLLCTDWREGMGRSLAFGVGAIAGTDADAVIVSTCDMPFVTAEHLRALAARPEQVTASEYEGRSGVPACFPRRMFTALQALKGEAGARSLLADAATVRLGTGAFDIDTPEDMERAASAIGS